MTVEDIIAGSQKRKASRVLRKERLTGTDLQIKGDKNERSNERDRRNSRVRNRADSPKA